MEFAEVRITYDAPQVDDVIEIEVENGFASSSYSDGDVDADGMGGFN